MQLKVDFCFRLPKKLFFFFEKQSFFSTRKMFSTSNSIIELNSGHTVIVYKSKDATWWKVYVYYTYEFLDQKLTRQHICQLSAFIISYFYCKKWSFPTSYTLINNIRGVPSECQAPPHILAKCSKRSAGGM